jgi:hypothetical protein
MAPISYSSIDVSQGWDGRGECFLISGKINFACLAKSAA